MRHHFSILNCLRVTDVLRLAGLPEPNTRGWFACPVHADRHPSAHIVPGGRGWRCFACGAHGGIVDLAVAVGIGHDRRSAARALEGSVGR